MVCPYCAENTEEGSVFCTKCGTRLAATVSTPVATRWPVPGAPAAIPGGPIAGDTFPYAESHTSGMAVGSLISGIFFFFFPVALIAIVLGHLSLSEIKKSAGRISGRGMAIAGLVLGYLGVAFIPLLIIAAIAIPNFTRAKMAANEAEAVGALKSYNYALATYAANCPAKGFPRSLENLGPREGSVKDERCKHEDLLDSSLGTAQPVKHGYRFEYVPGLPNDLGQITKFELFARPVAGGKTGVRYFFVDETTIIRASPNSLVNEDSPALQGCC